MATRMQQRRGTATQWTTANPILSAGEIGFESDTNKFKIGDGTNTWANLDYFIDETELGTTLGDYVETSLLGQALGVATLNASGKLESSQVPNIDELAQDAVDSALVAGTGISKTYNDNANTITIAVDTTVIATKAELAEVSQDSINDALTAGTGLTKNYNDNANTLTLAIDSTVTTNTGSQTLTNKSLDLANNTVTGTVAQFNTALSDANFVTTADTGTVTSTMIADGTIVDGDINASAAIALSKLATDPLARANHTGTQTASTISDFNEAAQDAVGGILGSGLTYTDASNTITVDSTVVQLRVSGVSDTEIGYLDGVTSNVQSQLNSKAALAGATFTGNVVVQQDFQVDGNFTVNGSNVLVSATQIQIEDSIVQLAHQNPANTVDLGIVAGYNDGTAKHAGLVKDATDAKWKLFKGVTDEPTTTVNFTQATLDDLAVGGLEATSLSVGTVSNTEIGYLDGVTSNVQSQLDAKAPINNASFTGTFSAPSGTITSTMIADGTIVNADISASAAIDKTKISGTAITAADTGTVTSTMIADETIVNADISNTAAIAQSKIANLTTDLAAKASITGTETLTNKTVNLANNTVTGTLSQFNTALSDADFATLAGTETLSGKTLANATVTGTVTAGGGVGTSGQYLESTGTGVRWTTVTGYAAPTLGSTSIASGATVTTIAGLTLTAPTLTGTVNASGDINLSAVNGPGSLIDELNLLMMGAL